MKKIFYAMFITFSILLVSCDVINISSNKSAIYNQPLSKIFVNGNIQSRNQAFGDTVCSTLVQSLINSGIQAAYANRGPLSLDSKYDIQKAIADYNPAQLMNIKFTSFNPDSSTVYSMEISITDMSSNKIVWKGLVNDRGFYNAANAKKCASLIMQKLSSDNLLPNKSSQ